MTRSLFSSAGIIAALAVPSAASGAAASDAEALTHTAQALVGHLAAKEFVAATAGFDDPMKQALTPTTLARVWGDLQAQVGAFEAVVSTAVEKGPPAVVYVRCHFEKADLDAKVALDAGGRISGLFFVPATDHGSWKAPAYVRQDEVREVQVTVGEKPWVLPAMLTTPAARGPHPAVVLVHGSGPNDMDESVGRTKLFKDLALGLATRGIAVLRYDKRTKVYGKLASEGLRTVDDEVITDAVAALRLAQHRSDLDPRRVFVLGHSLGGQLVPRIARQAPGLAGGIVMAGATRPFGDLVVDQITYLARLDGAVDASEQKEIAAAERFRAAYNDPGLAPDGSLELLGSRIPNSYWLDLRAYRPKEVAATLGLPLLFLQGERDYQVTLVDLGGWRSALEGHPNATFRTYRDLNHLFTKGSGPPSPAEYEAPGHVAEEVVADIARFVLGE